MVGVEPRKMASGVMKICPRMASETPAKIMGVFDRKGSIEEGKDADIIVFDKDINLTYVKKIDVYTLDFPNKEIEVGLFDSLLPGYLGSGIDMGRVVIADISSLMSGKVRKSMATAAWRTGVAPPMPVLAM